MHSHEDLELDDNDPSTQLLTDLRTSITHALSTRRPLLTHLNADTTWLLSLPIPLSHPSNSHPPRKYYHILIDPWLTGPQSDVAAFFSTQWHAIESCCQSIADVEEVVKGIEDVAASKSAGTNRPGIKRMETEDVIVVSTGTGPEEREEGMDVDMYKEEDEGKEESWIDAVVISHEFTDHMHAPTLLSLPPTVPVFATSKAFSVIKS
jgi:hypothetical protein